MKGGYLFNLGKVEAGATFRIDYKIEVQDDINLKQAVVVRNLFRADYKNIGNQKITCRSDVTLNLVEPRLQVSKNVIEGYLVWGETITIELKLKNTGSDGTYRINLSDSIPSGTSSSWWNSTSHSPCPLSIGNSSLRGGLGGWHS